MTAQELVAHNLRKLRVKRGLSQENLAVDAQIDRTYVSRIERGLENPTIIVLERIALALNVLISDFFTLPAEGESRPLPLSGGRHRK